MSGLIFNGNEIRWMNSCPAYRATASGQRLFREGVYVHAPGFAASPANRPTAQDRAITFRYSGALCPTNHHATRFFTAAGAPTLTLHNQAVSMASGIRVNGSFFGDASFRRRFDRVNLTVLYLPWIKTATPWMATAHGELGVTEFSGATRANPRIVNDYFGASGYWGEDDSGGANAWCASFVAWVMTQHGYTPPSASFRALSWRNFGREISTPVYGAIGIKTRRGGGHVAFVVGKSRDSNYYYMLGGNQDDQVMVTRYSARVWDSFVVPADYNVQRWGELPVWTGSSEDAGSEQ